MIDRRKELVEAAARGITEWLNTTRGVRACGTHPKVEINPDNNSIQVISADGITTYFSTMEM